MQLDPVDISNATTLDAALLVASLICIGLGVRIMRVQHGGIGLFGWSCIAALFAMALGLVDPIGLAKGALS